MVRHVQLAVDENSKIDERLTAAIDSVNSVTFTLDNRWRVPIQMIRVLSWFSLNLLLPIHWSMRSTQTARRCAATDTSAVKALT